MQEGVVRERLDLCTSSEMENGLRVEVQVRRPRALAEVLDTMEIVEPYIWELPAERRLVDIVHPNLMLDQWGRPEPVL